MNRQVLVSALIAAVVGGLLGGFLVKATMKAPTEFAELKADHIVAKTIDFDELISQKDKHVFCHIKDGVILTEKSVIAGEVKGRILVAGNLLVASNPVANVPECKVYAELAAGSPEKGGAVFILRSQKGAVNPGQKEIKDGVALVLGFDAKSEAVGYAQNFEKKTISPLYHSQTYGAPGTTKTETPAKGAAK